MKASEKVKFQYENDIRKSKNFFLNAMRIFEYANFEDEYNFVYEEYMSIFKEYPLL